MDLYKILMISERVSLVLWLGSGVSPVGSCFELALG